MKENNGAAPAAATAQTLAKKPEASRSTGPTGLDRAAIFLVSLGNETSSQVLRHLTDDEVEMVTRAVARLPPLPTEQAEAVLEEFRENSFAHKSVVEGGVDYARKMLTEAFGPEAGMSIVDRMLKSLGNNAAELVALQKSDPKQLAQLVYNEHPQVIALVMSHLVPAQAAALLVALPVEIRADVAKRMAQIDQFSPEIVEKLAAFIGRRLKALGEFSRESYGGVRAVAEMLNRLDTQENDELLGRIGEDNNDISENIRRFMFVFEDLKKLDGKDLSLLISRVDRKTLALALKGTSDNLRSFVMLSISGRAAEMLKEEIETMGSVKVKEVEAAQHQIIAIMRQLQTEGVIGAQGAGDKYVS